LRGNSSFNPRWLGYTLCNVGVTWGSLPLNLLLLYYLTQIVGIPAGLSGLIIALPKIWDALVDPMFGGWVDQWSMRIGSRAPAIVIATMVFVATLGAVFALPSGLPTYQVAAIAVALLILSSIAQTAIGVSQFAVATEMTKGPVDLSGLLALAAVVAQILSVAGSVALPLLVANLGGGATGYTSMAIVMAGVVAVALFGFVLSTRFVPVRTMSADTASASVWQSLRRTIGNKSFYNFLGLVVCLNGSIVIMLGFLPFANEYVLRGDAKTLAFLEGTLGITAVLGMVLAPFLLRRVGDIQAMLVSNVASAVAMIALLFAASGPVWASYVALGVIGLGSGVIGVMIQTSILGAAQKKLADGTVVALGFYLGIMVAATKLGSSAGAFISGQFLNFFGFVSGAATQSADAMIGLRLGYTLAPCLFVLLGTVFLYRNWRGERLATKQNVIAQAVEDTATA
jgi:GPH family glycoside/pentoside/hexuronide:cation symporter